MGTRTGTGRKASPPETRPGLLGIDFSGTNKFTHLIHEGKAHCGEGGPFRMVPMTEFEKHPCPDCQRKRAKAAG